MLAVVNKWGIAAIIAMVAVLPTGFALAALSGGNTPTSVAAAVGVMLVAISCGVIASKHGSRWWLLVPVVATVWICVVLLQMVIRE